MLPRRVQFAVVALVVALAAAGVAARPVEPSQGATCPKQPGKLSRRGEIAERYTMLLRINRMADVTAYSESGASDGGLPARVRRNDIFLINTRYDYSDQGPTAETALAASIRQSFPCNRIVSLNGLSHPRDSAGYAYSLVASPLLFGVLFDWEEGDWDEARKTAPKIGTWSYDYALASVRASRHAEVLGRAIRRAHGSATHIGLATSFLRDWDHADLADRMNTETRRKFGKPAAGIQAVQTQAACTYAGPGGFRLRTRHIMRQYRGVRVIKKKVRDKHGHKRLRRFRVLRPIAGVTARNLALEISFSATPNPHSNLPVASTSAGLAARCTRSGLKQGGGAFLYWAKPEAIEKLLDNPRICPLRPPPGGPGECPG